MALLTREKVVGRRTTGRAYLRSQALMSLLTGARPRLLALTSSPKTFFFSAPPPPTTGSVSASPPVAVAEEAESTEPTLRALRRVGESTAAAAAADGSSAAVVEVDRGAGEGALRDLTKRGRVDVGAAVWARRPGGKGAEGRGVECDCCCGCCCSREGKMSATEEGELATTGESAREARSAV